ncbi:MAG: hypothetical protein GSR86_04090 [Desulfurococcales archaeon]|nr:hypothetical protein [Desulfurococcales archaeon]
MRVSSELIAYAAKIATGMRARKPGAPSYMIEAAANVGLRLRPSTHVVECRLCGARLASMLGLYRHLLNKHSQEVWAMIEAEAERIASSWRME